MLREQLAQSIASEVMIAVEEVANTYAAYNVSLEIVVVFWRIFDSSPAVTAILAQRAACDPA